MTVKFASILLLVGFMACSDPDPIYLVPESAAIAASTRVVVGKVPEILRKAARVMMADGYLIVSSNEQLGLISCKSETPLNNISTAIVISTVNIIVEGVDDKHSKVEYNFNVDSRGLVGGTINSPAGQRVRLYNDWLDRIEGKTPEVPKH